MEAERFGAETLYHFQVVEAMRSGEWLIGSDLSPIHLGSSQ